MASMSRFVLKDCKFNTHEALYKPSSCLPAWRLKTQLAFEHKDLRSGSAVSRIGSVSVIQSKRWSPVTSRYHFVS
uniref:Uncharacterized protein n=1 Tax=Rhizophora mucronata TaxID=61149 RepID=A0A2P2LB57_RHIMU